MNLSLELGLGSNLSGNNRFAQPRFFTDAAGTSRATVDGDLVASYRDPVSRRLFTATGTARPTLRLISKVGGGTMPVMEFDGVSNILTLLGGSFAMGSIYAGFMSLGYPSGYIVNFQSPENLWFTSGHADIAFKLYENGAGISNTATDNYWQRQAICRPSVGQRQFRRSGVTLATGAPTDVTHTGTFSIGSIFKGYISAVLFDDGNAYNASLDTVIGSLGTFLETRANIVWCDGDSMTAGSGSTGQLGAYPGQMEALLGNTYRVLSSGVPSQTLVNMTADAAAEIDANWPASATKKVVVLWGGTNDLVFGASAATVNARLSTYWAARRAAGDKVIAVTILPRSNGGTPGSFDADRLTVNTYIRAHSSEYDGLADVAGNATIGDSGDETNTTYYADLVHMTNAGYALVASSVSTAILALP